VETIQQGLRIMALFNIFHRRMRHEDALKNQSIAGYRLKTLKEAIMVRAVL
jgi:hypothetical protein